MKTLSRQVTYCFVFSLELFFCKKFKKNKNISTAVILVFSVILVLGGGADHKYLTDVEMLNECGQALPQCSLPPLPTPRHDANFFF